MKKNKRIVLTDDEKDLADMKYNIEDKFLLEQDKVELHKKINNLDSQIKEIFYLRLFANLSFKEIGEIMGKSEVWARVNFYRGKEKMKESEENEKRMFYIDIAVRSIAFGNRMRKERQGTGGIAGCVPGL